jgi:hypothetical protein
MLISDYMYINSRNQTIFQKHTSCGYVNVEANILETDEATATSRAPSLSIAVLSETKK